MLTFSEKLIFVKLQWKFDVKMSHVKPSGDDAYRILNELEMNSKNISYELYLFCGKENHSIKNIYPYFHVFETYLTSSNAFRAFFNSSFIVSKSRTRAYFR